jgi:hypothetical protein
MYIGVSISFQRNERLGMSKYNEMSGEIVDELRALRKKGAPASELVHFLMEKYQVYINSVTRFIEAAFDFDSLRAETPPVFWPVLGLMMDYKKKERGEIRYATVDHCYEPLIERTRMRWLNAGPFPDMLRRRDRYVFQRLAEKHEALFAVSAPNPYSRSYVGKPGFRPSPPGLLGFSRMTEPHRGLISIDPSDERLGRILELQEPRLSLGEYRASIENAGYQVSSSEEGNVVRDTRGAAFFPGYYLLAVYSWDLRVNAYTHRRGEALRAEMNRRLGMDLVIAGPNEILSRKSLLADHPLHGKPFPALVFARDGLEPCFDEESLQNALSTR